jgi:nucleoside-diphosphate-sugar epimerase
LDFEANLEIVRKCAHYKKRVIFPSTSEVYGMSEDSAFNEETSNLVLGPIHKQRWIYSCSKQLLDRVIYAYGIRDGLDYTLFRPFNWVGPKLDNIYSSKEGSSRAVTQFIWDILHKGEVKLVDGGQQRRTFTCIDDGIAALLKIIENKDGCATGRIFNLGNPKNDISIQELVDLLIDLIKTYPDYREIAEKVRITSVDSNTHYGVHYQDTRHRVPAIQNAQTYLGWSPTVGLREALKKTLDYHLNKPAMALNDQEAA